MNYTFGTSKEKEKIYYRKIDDNELDYILETETAICKSMAILLRRILTEFGIDIIVDMNKAANKWHVYNAITLKDGRSFKFDLEEDLEFIQSGSKTRFFGMSEGSNTQDMVDEDELRRIDKEKADYIPWGFYFDDMIWMLKLAISSPNLSLEEKLEMVLDNLNVYVDTRNMKYREMVYYHNRVLQEVFSEKELNKIHQINCHRKDGDKKYYVSSIVLERPKDNTRNIYIFSYKNNCYEQISIEQMAHFVNEGLVLDAGIPGLNGLVKKSRDNLKKCMCAYEENPDGRCS